MLDFFCPRGIRNANPGNIRLCKPAWLGQKTAQLDKDFSEFTDPVFGLRALMRLLIVYQFKYGLKTVEQIINRFAPPHENATDNYIFFVAKALKVKRTDEIDLSDKSRLMSLAAAIVRRENGPAPDSRPRDWYPPDLYDRAATLAFDHKQQGEYA